MNAARWFFLLALAGFVFSTPAQPPSTLWLDETEAKRIATETDRLVVTFVVLGGAGSGHC